VNRIALMLQWSRANDGAETELAGLPAVVFHARFNGAAPMMARKPPLRIGLGFGLGLASMEPRQ